MIRNTRHVDRVLALALALGAFLLYLRTLAPGVLDGDSGEWQYMANILGVPHSTGYPLYLLLAKPLTLLPLGSAAWRVNLFSALCAAAAIPVIYLLALRVSKSRPASLLAAVLFALAPTLWASAVEAEVYALNTLLIALLFYFAVRWYDEGNEHLPGQSAPLMRNLYFMALAWGLALDNHRVSLFIAPGLCLLLWVQRRWLNRQRLALAAVLVAVPLLLYAYIPIRASQLLQEQSPASSALYGRPEAILDGKISAYFNPTPYGFFNLVTGFDNRNKLGFQDTGSSDALTGRLTNSLSLLLQQFNPLALILIAVGIFLVLKRDRALALFLLAAAAGIATVALVMRAESTRFYFSGAYLVLALFLAEAVGALLAQLQNQWRLRALIIGLLALMPLYALVRNFPQMDESRFTEYDGWARQILADNLAPGAVVIAPWELATGLRYFQFVEGQRTDLLVIHESPVRPQFQKLLATAHNLKRPFYYVLFTPEDKNAPGPRSVQTVGLPLMSKPQPHYALNEKLTDSVRVLGYDWTPDPARPGEFARLAVYYQVVADSREQYTSQLDLNDIRGDPHGHWERAPVTEYYPTYLWQPGDFYRDVWDISLPPDAPSGLYTLSLNWYRYDAATNTTHDEDPYTLNLGPMRVGNFSAGQISQAQHVEFSNGVTLLGYSTPERPPRGQPFKISLYWSAARPIEKSYTIFVHLEDANGVVRAQSDRAPWDGMFPTDRWVVGETVRDEYILQAPAELPQGEYQVRVGLYQTPDLRVPLVTGGDQVSLGFKLRLGEK